MIDNSRLSGTAGTTENATSDILPELVATIEGCLKQYCQSDVASVKALAEYALLGGGKRLRPLVMTLTGRILGAPPEPLLDLSVSVELLHCATLVHDDLIDASSMRRGRTSVNHRWGQAKAVLIGDFIYARCFEIISRLEVSAVRAELAKTARELTEAELLQLENEHHLDISKQTYRRIIDGKSASLFRFCTLSAGLIAHADEATLAVLREFGTSYGMAFQIHDDCLDFSGATEDIGKNVGDDLRKGRITMPLIIALQDPHCREELQQCLTELRDDSISADHFQSLLERVIANVCRPSILEKGQHEIELELNKAQSALAKLPPCEERDLLQSITLSSLKN